MTRIRQTQQTEGGAFAQRTGLLGRLLWTRALPGGVAVIAALTFPEFSVGAGEFADAKREPDPVKPPSIAPSFTGQGLIKQGSDAARQPLAGVRYGALLEVAETRMIPNGQSRTGQLAAAATSPDDMASAPSRPVESTLAIAPVTAPITSPSVAAASLPKAKRAPLADVPLGEGPLAPVRTVSKDELDAAATYAASVIDSYVTPAGLGARASFAPRAPALERPISVDALDAAANYTAFVLDSFVPPPAVVQSPALRAAPATKPLLESSAVEASVEELAATPSLADLAGDAGLTAPLAIPLRSPVSATSQPAAMQVAGLQSPAASPAVFAAAAPKPAPQAAALAPLPKPPGAAPAPGLGTNAPFPLDIKSQLVTRVDGKAAGAVDFQQTANGLTVRLGSIVDVLSDRYDSAQIARIRGSAASNIYISLADLQAQGIPISYDPVYDEFNVGQTDTRPKSARKVHMDQISTPERGLGTTAIDQVRR